jgi:hypothetical protein
MNLQSRSHRWLKVMDTALATVKALRQQEQTYRTAGRPLDYVRELRVMFGSANSAIERLDKAIEHTRDHADAAAAQALADAKIELQRFDQRLKQLQAVDLHWAAGGAFIMAVGYALSYFSCFRY